MQSKEKNIKLEYMRPSMEVWMFEEMPHTIVEASSEYGSGTDLEVKY